MKIIKIILFLCFCTLIPMVAQKKTTDLQERNLKGQVKSIEQTIEEINGNEKTVRSVIYSFNQKGMLLMIISKDAKGIRNGVVECFYNSNGQLVKRGVLAPDGIDSEKFYGTRIDTFKYNASGKLIESYEYREKCKTIYKYNAKGLLASENYIYDNKTTSEPVKYEYDAKGNLTGMLFRGGYARDDISYNAKNQITQYCGDGYCTKYKYNEWGDAIEEIESEYDEVMSTKKISYKYDNLNNWTQQIKQSIPNSYKRIANRKISYYGENEPEPVVETKTQQPVKPQGKPILLSSPDLINKSSTATQSWNGTASSLFQSGEGSRENPYIIETPEQLAFLAQTVNAGNSYSGKYFRIMNDLDLGGASKKSWIPIGNSEATSFAGTLWGEDKIISNLFFDAGKSKAACGLFGYLSDSSRVAHIILDKSCNIKGDVAGGIAGNNRGKIGFCVSKVNISGNHTGGIAGENMGLILACYSNATIKLSKTGGGICAKNMGNISLCAFQGKLSHGLISNACGGIAGKIEKGGKITDCYNRGDISSIGVVSKAGILGSIDYDEKDVAIINCYSAGTGYGDYIIFGDTKKFGTKKQSEYFSNCYFDIDVKPLTDEEKKEIEQYTRIGACSSSQLKSDKMVENLNAGRKDHSWIKDVNNINGGYPVLVVGMEKE